MRVPSGPGTPTGQAMPRRGRSRGGTAVLTSSACANDCKPVSPGFPRISLSVCFPGGQALGAITAIAKSAFCPVPGAGNGYVRPRLARGIRKLRPPGPRNPLSPDYR